MSIIWAGGEDLDFPNGVVPGVSTTTGNFRAGWARCAISPGGNSISNFMKSTPFDGGATITSGWLRWYAASTGTDANTGFFIGFGNLSTSAVLGVYVTGGARTWALGKNEAGTITQFAATTVAANSGANVTHRYDLQVTNYGASGTLSLYIDGNFIISYTGNIAMTGVSNFNCVQISNGAQNAYIVFSEIIAADESTLGFQGLATLAPNGNGTTQAWSNPAYTNFNPISYGSDLNSTFTNTTGQDEQATMIAVPTGTFQIKCVKVIARAMATAGAAATNLKIGFNNTNNGTVAEGATHALSTGFAPVEDYFATDPTSAGGTGAWGANLTGYQLELRSA